MVKAARKDSYLATTTVGPRVCVRAASHDDEWLARGRRLSFAAGRRDELQMRSRAFNDLARVCVAHALMRSIYRRHRIARDAMVVFVAFLAPCRSQQQRQQQRALAGLIMKTRTLFIKCVCARLRRRRANKEIDIIVVVVGDGCVGGGGRCATHSAARRCR